MKACIIIAVCLLSVLQVHVYKYWEGLLYIAVKNTTVRLILVNVNPPAVSDLMEPCKAEVCHCQSYSVPLIASGIPDMFKQS